MSWWYATLSSITKMFSWFNISLAGKLSGILIGIAVTPCIGNKKAFLTEKGHLSRVNVLSHLSEANASARISTVRSIHRSECPIAGCRVSSG
jgi:hypothetical protein